MRKISIFALPLLAFTVSACSGGGTVTDAGGDSSATTDGAKASGDMKTVVSGDMEKAADMVVLADMEKVATGDMEIAPTGDMAKAATGDMEVVATTDMAKAATTDMATTTVTDMAAAASTDMATAVTTDMATTATTDMATTATTDMATTATTDMAMIVVLTGDMATIATTDLATAASTDMPAAAGDMGAFPAAPTLGDRIDRLGRAAVNTALTDPFWDDGTQTAAGHHAKQDQYNAASDPTSWATVQLSGGGTSGPAVTALLAGALGVYDSLDGTSDGVAGVDDGCGNQLAFNTLGAPDYGTLATVLTDDQLYVNTNSGTCTTYLAVEAGVLGVTNTDCGGRTPNYNTIDITYSAFASASIVLAPGCLTGAATCGVTSGITSDPDATPANTTTFPYLGAPN